MSAHGVYIGVAPCGCVGFGCSADPKYAKGFAKDIADVLRRGWKIELVSTEDARNCIRCCIHSPEWTAGAAVAPVQESLL